MPVISGDEMIMSAVARLVATACFAACVYGPPYKAILKVGRIQAGQVVLVTGASGGLGLATIQICSAAGGRSIAITSSEARAHTPPRSRRE